MHNRYKNNSGTGQVPLLFFIFQEAIFKRICKEVEPIENEQNLKLKVPRQKRSEDMTYEEIMLDIFGEV